jgi:argininosuccinate lyase
MTKAWGGRFTGGTDERVEHYTESISFDHRLYDEDITGSIAHATMLAEVGLITPADAEALIRELENIRSDFAQGRIPHETRLEDVHMHVETELIRRLGDIGRKLHTGRSRNDQVATDVRLWVRRHLDVLDDRLRELQRSLTSAGSRWVDLILPAYTHLQRAQPISAGHYFLAYVEKLNRDRERVRDCRRRVNVLPLGSAAVAGSTLPLDRRRVAELLGFDAVANNSIDATSDRDFVTETIFVLAMVAVHLSGWAEEWILWSTTEFGFLELPDAFCTGSSIMPHKKNPDILELMRGRASKPISSLMGMLLLLKGLPLAYNRDLQDDKRYLFEAMDSVLASLEIAAAVVEGASFRTSVISERIDHGFLDATTLMERLIEWGLPMRTAHESVGKLVRACEDRQCTLAELPDAIFQEFLPGNVSNLKQSLGVHAAVSAYKSQGSSAPELVRQELQTWRQKLGMNE